MIKRQYFISVQVEMKNEIRHGWFTATNKSFFANPGMVINDLIRHSKVEMGCVDDAHIKVLAFNRIK